jgi:hypothetical protein
MNNLDFSTLRLNCNRVSRIFAHNPDCIKESELDRIEALKKKYLIKDLTPKESARLEELENKRDDSGFHIVNKPTQNYLWFIYLNRKYGAAPKIITGHEYGNPFAPNGIIKEPYVIGLIEQVAGMKLYRNKATIKNDFLHGIVDAIDEELVEESNMVHEIKTTSDRIRFNFRRRYPLDKQRFLQAQGYLAISGKDQALIHYCLVDYPESIIQEQKKLHRDSYIKADLPVIDFENYWSKQESFFRHKNIPDKDRLFTCLVPRDEAAIEKIYKKVVDCRTWLNELVEFMENTKHHHIVEQNKIRI